MQIPSVSPVRCRRGFVLCFRRPQCISCQTQRVDGHGARCGYCRASSLALLAVLHCTDTAASQSVLLCTATVWRAANKLVSPLVRIFIGKFIIAQMVVKLRTFIQTESSSPCSQKPAVGRWTFMLIYLEPNHIVARNYFYFVLPFTNA